MSDNTNLPNKAVGGHVEWLIEQRYRNQKASANLFKLIEKEDERSPHAESAQTLIAVGFSLWRAAFLADKKNLKSYTYASAKAFLQEILEHNAAIGLFWQ
jgi:hypothetical protein